jgi:hypothetical protein
MRALGAVVACVLAILLAGPAATAFAGADHTHSGQGSSSGSTNTMPPASGTAQAGSTFNGVPLGNGGNGQAGCATKPGPDGHRLSTCHPGQDGYVPNINAATDEELMMATELFKKVQAFCEAHPTASELTRAGFRRGASGNHWHNKKNPISFDADQIRTAITPKGGNTTLGTAFRTGDLPDNSLIRWHPPGGPTYTFHAWCAGNVTDMLRARPVSKGPLRGGSGGHSH